MKKITENIRTILFAITLLFFTSNIFANEIRPTVKVLNAKNKVFALIIDDAKLTNINIKITDTEGFVLLNEKAKINNKVSKSYNLSTLPSGIYEIELEDDISFRKQIVKLTFDKLEVLEEKERKIYKPVVKKDGDYILLNALILGEKGVEVAIFDEKGIELFSEKFENVQTIHRKYNIADINTKNCSVRVIIGEKDFRTYINL